MQPGPRQPRSIEYIEQHIIFHRGRKAIKDADLARYLDISVDQLYRRAGHGFLMLSHSSWFRVEPEKRAGRGTARPCVAFTLQGVIFIAALLNDDAALEACIPLLTLLKTRRRSSKNKDRRKPRAANPSRKASYDTHVKELKTRFRNLTKG